MTIRGVSSTSADGAERLARNSVVGRVDERRVVAVVFADIAGFTALSEVLDHEDITQLMFECWERLDGVLEAHGAVVDKHIGDAVLATFGTRLAREDDPVRAVRAALALQVRFAEFAAEVEAETGQHLQLRCAVTMGEVTVGLVAGSTTEVSVTGSAVNRASRLQGVARAGTVVADEPIHWASAWAIEYGEAASHDLKGIEGTVRAWEAFRPRDTRARLDQAPPPSGRIIGRDGEHRALSGVLLRLASGGGATVAVVGEAGSGKSALVAVARNVAHGMGLRWLDARAHSYASSEPYGVLRQILSDLLYLPGETDPAAVRSRLMALIEASDSPGEILADVGSSRDRLELLSYALGLPSDAGSENTPFDSNPSLRRRLVERAVRAVIESAARSTPIIISIEDTQWCDELSASALLHVAEATANHQLVVLIQGRSVSDPLVGETDKTRVIKLGRLSDEHARQLASSAIASLVGTDSVVRVAEQLLDRIVTTASGNPYFIVEFIKLLHHQGRLTSASGMWDLKPDRAGDVQDLPSTVRTLATAQIDQVPQPHRRYLQLASVIGARFTVSLLASFTGNQLEARLACDALIAADLIALPEGESAASELVHASGEPVYSFRQGLVRDAAYELLARRDRRRLHGIIGRQLTSADGSWPNGAELAVLAHHLVRGDDPARAAEAAVVAGEDASGSFANLEAMRWFSMAIGAIDEAGRATSLRRVARPGLTEPATQLLDQWRHRARCGLGVAALAVSDVAAARASLTEALTAAERDRSLSPQEPDLCRLIARSYELGGASYVSALEWVDRGLTSAGAEWSGPDEVEMVRAGTGSASAIARLCLVAGLARMRLGEYATAATWAARAMHIAKDAVPLEAASGALGLDLAQAHNLSCILLHLRGETEAALAAGEESLRRYRALGDLVGQEKAHSNVADALLELGRTNESIAHFRASQELARRVGDPVRMAASLLNMGQALTVIGDEAGALDGYQQAVESLDRLGHVEGASICRTNMAGIYVSMAQIDAALEHLDTAERGFEAVGASGHLSEVNRVRSAALAKAGAGELALVTAQQAIDQATSLGRRVEEGAALRARAVAQLAIGASREAIHADFARSGELLEGVSARYEMALTYLAWADFAASAPSNMEADLARQLAAESSRLFTAIDATARARGALGVASRVNS